MFPNIIPEHLISMGQNPEAYFGVIHLKEISIIMDKFVFISVSCYEILKFIIILIKNRFLLKIINSEIIENQSGFFKTNMQA